MEAPTNEGSETFSGPKRIMVVEDERVTRRALEQLLAGEGYNITTAIDGSQALAEAQLNPPDLILLDLGLPSDPFGGANFDGFGVMLWLKRRMPERKIPIIVLTARQDATSRKTAMDLGAELYLTKPFKAEELFSAIRSVLGGS